MISVNIQNMDRVTKDFNAIQQRLLNPRTGLEVVAGKGFKDVVDHFAKEESPGGRWEALKKPRKRGGSKILQDSGRLRASLRFRTLQTEAHIFTQVVYAAAHNFGHTYKSKKNKKAKPRILPQREFMWISDSARASILETFKRFLVNG